MNMYNKPLTCHRSSHEWKREKISSCSINLTKLIDSFKILSFLVHFLAFHCHCISIAHSSSRLKYKLFPAYFPIQFHNEQRFEIFFQLCLENIIKMYTYLQTELRFVHYTLENELYRETAGTLSYSLHKQGQESEVPIIYKQEAFDNFLAQANCTCFLPCTWVLLWFLEEQWSCLYSYTL